MKYLFFGFFFCIILFAPFFFKGNYLFPGSFMTAWYEPWKSELGTKGGAPTIVHKPLADDVFRQLYPMKKFAAEALSSFHLPLWNPYNGAGQPLLATMHPGYLNPFSILLALFPNGFGWTLYVFMQVPFLFAGMFLYMRVLGVSRSGSFASSSILCLSGFVTVRLVYGDYIYALAYFVWLLSCIEWYRNHPHHSFMLLFISLCTACIWFSTQPQIALYLLVYALVYSLFMSTSRKTYPSSASEKFSPQDRGSNNRDFKIRFNSVFIAILLGTGIASIQLMPTLELYTLSVIDAGTSSFIIDRFLLPVSHFISFLIPNYFGNQGTYNYFGAGDFVESMAAFGSIPLVLALASKFSQKLPKRLFWFLSISAIAAVVLSISSPLTRFIYGIPIPILSTSIPSRVLILAVFSLSVLAGFGTDHLLSQKRIKEVSKPFVFVGFFIVFALLYALYLYATHVTCPSLAIANCRMTSVRTNLFELIVFLSCSLFLLISVKIKVKWIQNISIVLFILVFVGAGLYNAEKLLPFSPKEMMYPKSELVDALQKIGKADRVFGIGDGKIATNISTELKLFDPEYYDPLYIKRYGELVAYAHQGPNGNPLMLKRSDVEIIRDATISAEIAIRRERLFDLLSVKYLYGKLSDLPVGLFTPRYTESVWESKVYRIVDRPTSLPHAFLVHQYTVKKSDQEVLSTLFDPSFNPQSSVILENDPVFPISLLSPLSDVSDSVIQESSQNEYLKFSVKARAPGIFVLTDNFYPGWHAKVDGKEVKIYRANYSFRAVVIEKGEHAVEFFYRPDSLRYGFILSLFSIVVLVLYCGCDKNRTMDLFLTCPPCECGSPKNRT